MYVTQTYLGFTSTAAKVYIYFLCADHMGERESHLLDEFRSRTEEFGLTTDRDVAVLLPHEGQEEKVTEEIIRHIDDKNQDFYRRNIEGKTPGLLVTKNPIDRPNGFRGAIYFPLNEIEKPFKNSKSLVEQINASPKESKFHTFLDKLNTTIILQPNFAGLGIDLNAIIDNYLVKRSSKN